MLAALAVLFGVVIIRLVDLQVVSPGRYTAAGLAQRLRTITLTAERGSIFDRNGAELAMSVEQKTVWADPRAVKDPAAVALALAPILGKDPSALQKDLTKQGAFVYLARQIDPAVAAKVEALHLPGINTVDESKRFAPAGDLAQSVIGGVNLDNIGRAGLESQYDKSLLGIPGRLELEQGPDGRTIAGGRQKVVPAKRGSDLVLTIDRSLQFETERALADQMNQTRALHAVAVVSDPTTGEILAMANMGRDEQGNPAPTADNQALTVAFEPGSVNKAITMSGALEEGVVQPDTVLNVPDRLQVSTAMFQDNETHPPENWTVTDILTQSSNIGTIKIAQQLGVPRLQKYLQKFGLGQATGLAFPNETDGITKTGRWDGTDIGAIPIGQGVAVNAVQMLQVFNTLANGGVHVAPSLVREVVGPDGTETKRPPAARTRVVSDRTARQMTAMMTNVVKVGTGVKAKIDGYTVAGKTGTPRKPDGRGGYKQGAYMPTFVGFVPAEAPKLSVIVVLDEPQPYYAGEVAAPVFARIAQYGLRLFKIPPPANGMGVAVPVAKPTTVNRVD